MDRGEPLGVIHGELLCETLDIHPGERVLDVATGNGAMSLAAARRGADVTTIDSVEHSLASVARVAAACDLPLATQVAEPRDLPFEDDTFDVVVSAFGVMFAPDQQRVADEIVRVCRPAGRLGMAMWAPGSLIGEIVGAVARVIPPAPRDRPAMAWGTEERLRELFDNQISSLQVAVRPLTVRHRTSTLMVGWLRSCYGPTRTAIEGLDADAQGRLAVDLAEICTAFNRADDGTFVAPSDYVEAIAVIR